MTDTALPLALDRHSGRKMGKYEVLCRLSSGGMSEIFLAFQKGLAGFRKLVVLKQILPDIKAEEEIVKMFLDEARITAAFSHPNIAQVYDLDETEGELFLAMEFVPGATLIEVARACRSAGEAIPLGFSLAACRDTALALHYAHTFKDAAGRAKQVIHRDVAEKNVMVTYDGTTKLLDFGIAKAKGSASRTAVGKVKGTSGYMSPEQIMGLELDPRTDVFSLGVVLHECLTGMRLFYGKDAEEGMSAALNFEPPPPSEQNGEVSPSLDALVLRSLSREKEDRFGTALEMARAIEKASAGAIWHPEQSGEFIQRHFAERRTQTRELLDGADLDAKTGELRLNRRERATLREVVGNQPQTSRPPQSPQSSPPGIVKMGPLTTPPVARRQPGALPGTPGLLPPPRLEEMGQNANREVTDPFAQEETIIKGGPKDTSTGEVRAVSVGVPVAIAAQQTSGTKRQRADVAAAFPGRKRRRVLLFAGVGTLLALGLLGALGLAFRLF